MKWTYFFRTSGDRILIMLKILDMNECEEKHTRFHKNAVVILLLLLFQNPL